MATADRLLPLSADRTRRLGLGQDLEKLFNYCAAWVDNLPASLFNRVTQMAMDALICAFAIFVSYQLRFDASVPPSHQVTMWTWILILPLLRALSLLYCGGYDAIWRYFNLHDAAVLAITSTPPTIVWAIARFIVGKTLLVTQIPVSVIVLEYLLFVALAANVRVFRRVTFEAARRSGVHRRRTLLVGTADTLAGSLRQVAVFPDINIVGLLSTDEESQGMRIGGFSVMDQPSALPDLLTTHGVELVIIADASLDSIGSMVATATEFGVEVRLLPSAENVLRGDVRVSVLPKPDMAILDRTAARLVQHPVVVEAFRGRTVLITGAGGSIGAELSRQVARLPVSSLVLMDQDENAIFEISNELTKTGPTAGLVPVVGDIRDKAQVQRVFRTTRPHIVLHAAAYKHVPVMEENVSEAVINNVLGTREIADAAIECGAERFLMISTDKAVRPTSIMGATKRIAELLVQERGAEFNGRHQTRCSCVRFGNVMGSRGSVVPIFLRQIADGGPITITHEEMTRYFMTIPEAVQLVLQAVTLGSQGDLYMLDMGDPVKIADLARRLIRMSGLQPDKDIEIEIVGTRPGEKIHEQLWSEGAEVSDTPFERVLSVHSSEVPSGFVKTLGDLEEAAMTRDDVEVRRQLEGIPIDFRRSAQAQAAHA